MRERRGPIAYSADERAFLEDRKAMLRRDLHAAFVAAFGREDVSLENLKAMMKRNGWLTGRKGSESIAPWNKNKPMPFNAGSARTQFKPGHPSHTYRGPGHERFDERCGYVILIVAETNPWTGADTRPVLKHKWLWEQANGPVPDGHVLKCLDGDHRNTDPSNWQPIPKGMVPRLSLKRDYDHAPDELKPVIMTMARLEHTAHQRQHHNQGGQDA